MFPLLQLQRDCLLNGQDFGTITPNLAVPLEGLQIEVSIFPSFYLPIRRNSFLTSMPQRPQENCRLNPKPSKPSTLNPCRSRNVELHGHETVLERPKGSKKEWARTFKLRGGGDPFLYSGEQTIVNPRKLEP